MSNSESTPLRSVPEKTQELQAAAIQRLAVDILHCYFLMEPTHGESKLSIIDVLHNELPPKWQVSGSVVDSILSSLGGKQYWDNQYAEVGTTAEDNTVLVMQHIQAELLGLKKPGDSYPTDAVMGLVIPGRKRTFPEYFQHRSAQAVSWHPDAFTASKKITGRRNYLKARVGKEEFEKKVAWGSMSSVWEIKSGKRTNTVEAKFTLILRGAAVLNDNPFRTFVPMILLHSGVLTFMICDRSGVREWPAIVTTNGQIQPLVKLLAWLLFSTPDNQGFFQGIGLSSKHTEFGLSTKIKVEVPESKDHKTFELVPQPLTRPNTDVIDHRATSVYPVLEEGDLQQKDLILKVAWSHSVRQFEGAFLVAMEKRGMEGVPRLIAGCGAQSTLDHARGFRPSQGFRSKSGQSQIRQPYNYAAGSCPTSASFCGSDLKVVPISPAAVGSKRPREEELKREKAKKVKRSSEAPFDAASDPVSDHSVNPAVVPKAIPQDLDDLHNIYNQCQRTMALLVTPYCGVTLSSKNHDLEGKDPVTYYEIVLACMRTIDVISTLFVTALPEEEAVKTDSDEYPFPGMHRDISLNNIMVAKCTPDPRHLEVSGEVTPLIDFEFAAYPGLVTRSGAPHRTGTRLSMSLPLLQRARPPFHRPYFDFESVFWSLYYRLLAPIIRSQTGGGFLELATNFNELGDQKANTAANAKLVALTSSHWGYGFDLVLKHGGEKSDAFVVWVLLTRIKRYLFQDGLLELPESGYNKSLEKIAVESYYQTFKAKYYEDVEDRMFGRFVRPWGDDPKVVQEVSRTLRGMFIDALKKLAG